MDKYSEAQRLQILRLTERIKVRHQSEIICRSLAENIIDTGVKVMERPTLAQVMKFTKAELIKVLRKCPESERFLQSKEALNTGTISFKDA